MEQLEQKIGYRFRNKKLLRQALTHSSYANEKKLGKLGCNERLEFLGDAVLELISSDVLYARFPQLPEGELTKKRASLKSIMMKEMRCFLFAKIQKQKMITLQKQLWWIKTDSF